MVVKVLAKEVRSFTIKTTAHSITLEIDSILYEKIGEPALLRMQKKTGAFGIKGALRKTTAKSFLVLTLLRSVTSVVSVTTLLLSVVIKDGEQFAISNVMFVKITALKTSPNRNLKFLNIVFSVV